MLELQNIKIENYRSVKSGSIEVKEIDGKKCFMLFGVNEVGKSNFLKAISLLSKTQTTKYDLDCFRESKKASEPIGIRYGFSMNKWLKKLLETKTLPKELKSNIEHLEMYVSIKSDNTRSEEILFYYKNKEILKKFSYDESSKQIIVKTKDNEELTEEKLDELLVAYFQPEIIKELPKVIYWEPSEKFLITKPIDLNQFKANPEGISVPLKNMFNLMDVSTKNIPTYVEKVLSSSDEKEDFETEISKKVTKHINELWSEHNIEIKVRVEGTLCSVHVKDKDPEIKRAFSMGQRSDGFKQFISILLNLSIESRKGDLENALIILDEPEVHLHPSGVRYLKDELLKISEKNTVILASHSIYLVDKISLDRNKIVFKEQGETRVSDVDKDCPVEEEVIYEALGTSILEIIEPNLLLFEGTTDRDAYNVFADKFKEELSPPVIRTIAATGTKNMPRYSKFFKSKFVTGFMAVDSDPDGDSVKKQVKDEEADIAKNIFGIKDVITAKKVKLTLEDLFPKRVIEQAVKNTYCKDISLDDKKPIIDQVKKWKKDESLQDKDGKLEELKKHIIKIVLKDVKDKEKAIVQKEYKTYYNYVDKLIKKIKSVEDKSK